MVQVIVPPIRGNGIRIGMVVSVFVISAWYWYELLPDMGMGILLIPILGISYSKVPGYWYRFGFSSSIGISVGIGMYHQSGFSMNLSLISSESVSVWHYWWKTSSSSACTRCPKAMI